MEFYTLSDLTHYLLICDFQDLQVTLHRTRSDLFRIKNRKMFRTHIFLLLWIVLASTRASPIIPRALPDYIPNPNGPPTRPPNSQLVQLGFHKPLEWPVVASSPSQQSNIFNNVPPGVSYALQIPASQVAISYLRLYDTAKSLGYNTTLVVFWLPNNQVNSLQLQMTNPSSRLYNNPNPTVRSLMRLINPTLRR